MIGGFSFGNIPNGVHVLRVVILFAIAALYPVGITARIKSVLSQMKQFVVCHIWANNKIRVFVIQAVTVNVMHVRPLW